MSILVTGAAGFVGLATIEHLLRRGDAVLAADLEALPEPALRAFAALPGQLQTARLDVTDAAAFAALVAQHRPRAILHLAALTPLGRVPTALAIRTAQVNILGPLHAVAAAEAAGTGFLVLASSGAVFGGAGRDAARLDATIRPDPRSAYGVAKFAGERLGLLAGLEAGVAVAAVRLSTVFGRWERATPARPVASPIMRITEAALRGATVVVADEKPRDWVYSADVAAGLASVLDHGRAVAAPVHLTPTGGLWSMRDWCGALATRLPGLAWRHDPADPRAEPLPNDRAPLDPEALATLTGFRAGFGMEAALDDYLAWRRAVPTAA
ncbi:NAD-dependent epimerase/dehydratase family protein [Falsiroseomonas sp. E2-1-a20]|uniref:NAD-dependent epimerase/dehydratase family protein n=1 Tax=Falsiroseomonas sp. E2-1-a20 TaxID=3239300 RepID=UPI003F3759C9